MVKRLATDEGHIEYTLRRRRQSRSMRLSVYSDGRVIVSVPYFLRESAIESFLSQRVEWLKQKIAAYAQSGMVPAYRSNREDYAKYKQAALQLVNERLVELNAAYGFTYHSVRIKNQRSCWGSCSRRGNLNFSYKIALLPKALADYVIAHELCHLGEFNHSPRFWALVARTVPEYKNLRKSLKLHRHFEPLTERAGSGILSDASLNGGTLQADVAQR